MKRSELVFASAFVSVLVVLTLVFVNCKKKPFYKLVCKDTNLTATVGGVPYYSCVITVVNTNTECWINSNNGRSGFSKKYMVVSLHFPPAEGTYTLGDINKNKASANIQIGVLGSAYATDTIHNGTITVTKYDLSSKKASGTFDFSCAELPSGGGEKNITKGEFTDVKLQ